MMKPATGGAKRAEPSPSAVDAAIAFEEHNPASAHLGNVKFSREIVF